MLGMLKTGNIFTRLQNFKIVLNKNSHLSLFFSLASFY